MRSRAILLSLAAIACMALPARAQEELGYPPPPPVPPPSGIVSKPRAFALGAGVGHYGWEDPSLFQDLTMTSLSLERILWRGIRGRAAMGAGKTTLEVGQEEVDAWIMPFDLQVLVSPDFGPFHRFGVMPYAIGGFGTLVTNPSGDLEALELTTRSQSQWTYGGGILARVLGRFEARFEGTAAGVRLADPVESENRETQTVHNRRWEGRMSWLF
jgi:hypothetical protein